MVYFSIFGLFGQPTAVWSRCGGGTDRGDIWLFSAGLRRRADSQTVQMRDGGRLNGRKTSVREDFVVFSAKWTGRWRKKA